MILGTLTVSQPILFGLLLLIVVTIPYYTFNALKIAGPSSTFFLVTFCLSINLPIAPEEALLRGSAILIGGMLATITVILTIIFAKEKQKTEQFMRILKHYITCYIILMSQRISKHMLEMLLQNLEILKTLITSTSGGNGKLSKRFQKLILLHISTRDIFRITRTQ